MSLLTELKTVPVRPTVTGNPSSPSLYYLLKVIERAERAPQKF